MSSGPKEQRKVPIRHNHSTSLIDTIYPTKLLNKSKHEVYLAENEDTQEKYAMKFFHHKDGKINMSYLGEKYLVGITHPNIISIKDTNDLQLIKKNGQDLFSGVIAMEYAPYGDFTSIIPEIFSLKDEKLARTYFHQLIEGLDHLHSNGVAHMDMKLSNCLLGLDYRLKIADFDQIVNIEDNECFGRGTKSFRPPEIKKNSSASSKVTINPIAVDIYSAGIFLFNLVYGAMPYIEGKQISYLDLELLLHESVEGFWEAHKKIKTIKEYPHPDLKKLFESMVHKDFSKRATLREIKQNSWFKGSVYSYSELTDIMKPIIANKYKSKSANFDSN